MVKAPQTIMSVSCGAHHSIMLLADGSVWAWGSNSHGQLGDVTYTQGKGTTANGHRTTSAYRVPITEPIRVISAGAFHNLALTTEGEIWAWGSNCYNQVGDGGDILPPTKIDFPSTSHALRVSAGDWHSLALDAS